MFRWWKPARDQRVVTWSLKVLSLSFKGQKHSFQIEADLKSGKYELWNNIAFIWWGKKKRGGQELGSTSSCMYSLIDPSSNTLIIRARRSQLYYWDSVLSMLLSEWNLIDYFVVSLRRIFFQCGVCVSECLMWQWAFRQFSHGSAMWNSVVSQAFACNFSSAAFVSGGNIMIFFFPAWVNLHCFCCPILIPSQMSASMLCWVNL